MPVSEELKDKIAHFSNLPTLPQVATKLMGMINNPLTSASDVAFIVGQDLSLSAKVLRLANSAFYGIPRSINNIHNAVVILGLKVINTMVLSLTVFDMFPDDKKEESQFNRNAFWLHSLGCGLIAKFLTAKINKVILFDPEEAFCAGLLHDIGKVVMEQYMHDDFHKALTYATTHNVSLYDAEKQTLGYTHTDIADHLTAGWNLPTEIRLSLMYHHTLADAPECHDIISLCHLSDCLCYETGMVIDPDIIPPKLDQSAIERLKIVPEDIEQMKTVIPAELEKTSAFFNIVKN